MAPLDWGLGHATRCIPIIHELLRQGCDVLLAGEGKQKTLLQQEFPHLRFLHLPGYRIRYASSGWGLAVKIVAQIPNIVSAITYEQAWLKKVVQNEKIDAVISDNRYGLHHPNIQSVFLTHQLRIKAPIAFVEDFLQRLNYRYLNCFNECWVPDAADENNLAKSLSHPVQLPPIPVRYIGTLSRFSGQQNKEESKHLLILLSGPEPQRSLLQNLLLKELSNYKEPVILVRGLPGEGNNLAASQNVSVYSHLPAAELEQKIKEASFVIARCGYSTVMDLAALNKRSILIPTPGQTEQAYLAKHLMEKKVALCIDQKKFRLKQALELAASFPYQPFNSGQNDLKSCISSLIKKAR